MLAAAGWELRVVDPRRGAKVGMRAGDKVVALLDLRGLGAGDVESLGQVVIDHAGLPMIALTPDSDIDQPGLHPVLQACGERVVCPFNPQQLAQALSSFDRRAPGADDAGGLVGRRGAPPCTATPGWTCRC